MNWQEEQYGTNISDWRETTRLRGILSPCSERKNAGYGSCGEGFKKLENLQNSAAIGSAILDSHA